MCCVVITYLIWEYHSSCLLPLSLFLLFYWGIQVGSELTWLLTGDMMLQCGWCCSPAVLQCCSHIVNLPSSDWLWLELQHQQFYKYWITLVITLEMLHSQSSIVLNSSNNNFPSFWRKRINLNKPKMAYSRDRADMDYQGLSWTTMDYHGLLWTIVDFHGLSWTIMTIIDYHGLSLTIINCHGLSD